MGSVRSFGRFFLIGLSLSAIFFLLPSLVMRETVLSYLYSNVDDVPLSSVALIPGASVVRGAPSPILSARADAAISLWKSGRVTSILITGDNGERSYDEVTPVLLYVVQAGVPAQDIFLDREGFDTYTSMYRAHFQVGAQSVVIVTQDFHLPRAVFIARALGIDARGLATATGGTAFDYFRELPASWKGLIDLATHRVPEM